MNNPTNTEAESGPEAELHPAGPDHFRVVTASNGQKLLLLVDFEDGATEPGVMATASFRVGQGSTVLKYLLEGITVAEVMGFNGTAEQMLEYADSLQAEMSAYLEHVLDQAVEEGEEAVPHVHTDACVHDPATPT